ncbi:MAG: polysaccharide biosynthesis tyrosine autokinase [Nitrospirota bacterium]
MMEEKEIHLRDYLKVVTKRRHTVATFFVIVFILVVVGTLSSRSLYMASTKILIDRNDSRSLTTAAYTPYDPEFHETQYQLIKSTAVARKVVDLLGLDKTYDPDKIKGYSLIGGALRWFGGLFSFGGGSSAEKEDPAMTKADMMAKMISENIEVKPVKNSKIVEIRYYAPNPELARAIANSVTRAYIEQLLELNMSSTRYAIQWMTKKAEEEREKLDKSEKGLQEYVKDRNIVTMENKIAIVPQKLAELNSQLVQAETKKKQLEILYAKVKDLGGNLDEAETVSVVASDPSLQAIRQQILKAEQTIMELSQKYGKKHPAMTRALEDLNVLKAKREQEIRRIIDSIRNEYDMAKSNVATLNRFLGETKSEALNVNEKFMEYGSLNREVEANRQLYEALMKRIKEQSITEQGSTVNVLVVERAELPKSPAKPRKALNVFLGLIVGLFGGIGMAFFVEYLDNTVKTPEEVEARLGVPVYGMVSLLKEGALEGIVMREPTSPVTENYKAMRTALLLSSADRPQRKILVTSMGPEEGKTTTSVNLAMAIAQSEYKVLVIDADLRKPRIHKVFGLNNGKGLSTYLAGASDMKVMQKGPLPNLDVIPSGPIPPNPSELLSSNRMNEMIAALGKDYDFVICDSPPLLSVADSLMLSKALDGTIIVTRAGATTYDMIKRGLKSLADLKAHVLGIVINGMDVKKGDKYHYYNYYYSSAPEEAKR